MTITPDEGDRASTPPLLPRLNRVIDRLTFVATATGARTLQLALAVRTSVLVLDGSEATEAERAAAQRAIEALEAAAGIGGAERSVA